MINWILKKFDELSPSELYAILRLRNEVFIIEQNCIYQDLDNKDQASMHLMGWEKDELVAYTRILPVGVSYNHPSIGRVVTSPSKRRTGLGKELMEKSIEFVENLYGKGPIRIGAQLYLKKFYEELGFRQVSDIYDEDNIQHIEMEKK